MKESPEADPSEEIEMLQQAEQPAIDEERRGFLGSAAVASMLAGLTLGYGAFASFVLRFLYPSANSSNNLWQFVCTLDQLEVNQSMAFTMPSGAKVVVARQAEGETEDAFIALSSVCPHLGCKVHWEAVNDRFFCPCHNGAFNAQGAPTEGPPASANQSLTRYPLSVDGNILLIEVPVNAVTVSQEKTA